jgi:trans-2,3-dihydro-3-hydroxyanthranilate isomerase
MSWEYQIVDVFTQTALEGNALAVFPDAAGLDDDAMQRIARETNLSETTFVLPAQRRDCAVRVRIYTPRKEMRFAGHPTIGTAWVLRDRQIVAADCAAFNLEEPVGAVGVRVDGGGVIWLRTPAIETGPTYDSDACAAAIGLARGDLLDGIPCQRLSAGNPAIFIALRDPQTVDRAEVDSLALRRLLEREPEPTCIFVFAPTAQGAYSRMFANDFGILEDPATGSVTGPLAAYMMRYGLASLANGTRFVSEQGTKMGRRSMLHVSIEGDAGSVGIDVGGHVVPVARGTLRLD